jgi:hypothetical protein
MKKRRKPQVTTQPQRPCAECCFPFTPWRASSSSGETWELASSRYCGPCVLETMRHAILASFGIQNPEFLDRNTVL